ncbi:GSCFA domain-containing protein [Amycolatopsis sp. cmx-8-4]|uniref:GSCFA domain-containing protein n=1 Tax=Amycolatopsis sp. cmx-8-4 TaxID=2790947 RepID=UPI00397CF628
MNPYESQPARAFWRTAVAEPEPGAISDVWTPKFAIGQDDPVLTAGSCFAARLGRALIDHGMNFFDAEPPPPGLTRDERRARHFGEFSFRTGTIYTAAVLRQWLAWAFGHEKAPDTVWTGDGRCFDPYRPSVEPTGYASADDVFAAREETLAAIRRGVARARCLIFTLGLTEAWGDAGGTVYPSCPGTVRGTFDDTRHTLRTFTFADVHRDLLDVFALARAANPDIRFVLTVSPVPLTATAGAQHALVANTHAKSVLRGVAGQLAQEHDHVDYFPAYELITGQPFRSGFYEPNLREVTAEGVEFVMGHFTSALRGTATAPARERREPRVKGGDVCDDAVLDYYGPR